LINKRFLIVFTIFLLFSINIFSYEYFPQFKDKVELIKRFNEILLGLNINEDNLTFSELSIGDVYFDHDIITLAKAVSQKGSPNSVVFEVPSGRILYVTTFSRPFSGRLEKVLSIRLKALYYAGVLFSLPLEQIKIDKIDVHPQMKNRFFITFKRVIGGITFKDDIAKLTMDNCGNLILFENRMLSDHNKNEYSFKKSLTKKEIEEKVQKTLREKLISFNGYCLDNMILDRIEFKTRSFVNPDYFLNDKLIYQNIKRLKSGKHVDDIKSYIPLIKKVYPCVKIVGEARDKTLSLDFEFYVDIYSGKIISTERFELDFEHKQSLMEDYLEEF